MRITVSAKMPLLSSSCLVRTDIHPLRHLSPTLISLNQQKLLIASEGFFCQHSNFSFTLFSSSVAFLWEAPILVSQHDNRLLYFYRNLSLVYLFNQQVNILSSTINQPRFIVQTSCSKINASSLCRSTIPILFP